MNALPLISEFSDRGIIATVTGADLNLDAPKGALTPKLVSCLREDKRDVITWLDRLSNELGEDWQEVSQDPAQLKAAADSLMPGSKVAPAWSRAVNDAAFGQIANRNRLLETPGNGPIDAKMQMRHSGMPRVS